MMRKNTKVIVILGILFFIVSIVMYVLFFTIVSNHKKQFTALSIERATIQSHQKLLKELTQTLEETKHEREIIKDSILKEENIIDLLTLIESLGKEQGVSVITNSLNVTPINATFETLVVTVGVEGSYGAVLHILELFEALPYQSTINKVQITHTEEGISTWKGLFEIRVVKFKKV